MYLGMLNVEIEFNLQRTQINPPRICNLNIMKCTSYYLIIICKISAGVDPQASDRTPKIANGSFQMHLMFNSL